LSVRLPPVSEAEREAPQPQEAPSHEPESRWDRGRRYSHRTGLYVTLVVALATIVFLILLIARNTRQVKVDYVVDSTETGLIWLVVVSAITGWVLGIVTAFLIRRRTTRRRAM
jgi:uncharacterized integral membrane protein